VDAEIAKKYGIKEGSKVLKYDFVLVEKKEQNCYEMKMR